MQTPFLNSFGSKLAEQWLTTLLTPAFLFWGGGAVLWLGWQPLAQWLIAPNDPQKYPILIASLVLVTTSAPMVQRFDLPVLRFLEGYWPWWLRPLQNYKIRHHTRHFNHLYWHFQYLNRKQQNNSTPQALANHRHNRWPVSFPPLSPLSRWLDSHHLAQQQHRQTQAQERFQLLQQKQAKHLTDLTPQEWDEHQTLQTLLQPGLTLPERQQQAILTGKLRHYPARTKPKMPTRLGNLLRAAESRPEEKYGLNAIIVWPHLWLLLPAITRDELQGARTNLNTAARAWFWSALFLLWTPLSPWAIALSLPLQILIYTHWLLPTAETYATLIEAAFDLHRQALYQALRWPLPPTPADEHQAGAQLTAYLWQGSDANFPTFESLNS